MINVILGKKPQPPLITSIEPNSGGVGTPVTIYGSNFGDSQENSKIFFDSILANAMSWKSTAIKTLVPENAETETLKTIYFTVVDGSVIYLSDEYQAPADNEESDGKSNVPISAIGSNAP